MYPYFEIIYFVLQIVIIFYRTRLLENPSENMNRA
jgi:hypothetical protein